MALTQQQITAKQSAYHQQLAAAKTQAAIDKIVSAARAEGVPLGVGQLQQAKIAVTQAAKTAPAAAKPAAPTTKPLTAAQITAKAIADKQAQQAAQAAAYAKQAEQARAISAAAVAQKNQQQAQQQAAAAAAAKQRVAQQQVTQQAQQQAVQQQQAKTQALTTQLTQAKTPAQVDQVVAQAQQQGVTLNAGQIAAAKTAATQQEALAAKEALRIKTETYQNQLSQAGTAEDVTKLVEQAKAEGIAINPVLIERQQAQIKSTQATADFAKGLGTPSSFGSVVSPNGQEFVSLLDDPVTGQKGGWFQVVGGNLQRVGTDGRPAGAVIPVDKFNQQRQEAQGNYNLYQSQQKKAADAARLQEQVGKFESTLPQPGSAKFNYLQANRTIMTGPDGRSYEIIPANKATGEPARWVASSTANANYQNPNQTYVDIKNPAVSVTKGQVNQVYQTNAQIANQESQARRQALIAEQRAKLNPPSAIGDLLADFDKLVNKTIGWKTIATIAGSIVGGPLGATFASAAAGAVKGESLEQIAKGAAISFALAYGTQALSEALNQGIAQGLETGALPADDAVYQFADDISQFQEIAEVADEVHGFGDLPQTVIDAANATDDPIAALNAAQGYGNVDADYLRQIGASEELINVAEAHNTVNAATGGGGTFVGGEYTTAPEEIWSDIQGAERELTPSEGYIKTGGRTGEVIIEQPPPGDYVELPQPPEFPEDLPSTPDTGTGGGAGGGGGPVAPSGVTEEMISIANSTSDPIAALNALAGFTASDMAYLAAIGMPAAVMAAAAASNAALGAPTTVAEWATASQPVTPPGVPGEPGPVAPPGEGPTVPPGEGPTVPPGGPIPPGEGGPVTPPGEGPVGPPGEGPVTPPGEGGPGGPGGPGGEGPVEPPVEPPPEGPEIIDKSEPYTGEYSNESVLERYLKGAITYGDILKLIAAGLILPSVLGLIQGRENVKEPEYGPIPPINFGPTQQLYTPGVNPGFVINPAQQPFYQTTSPVQSRYFWGQRPLIERQEDISKVWLNPAQAPARPFGLQEYQRNYNLMDVINQVNQTALNPNFQGYSQLPTPGYVPPSAESTPAYQAYTGYSQMPNAGYIAPIFAQSPQAQPGPVAPTQAQQTAPVATLAPFVPVAPAPAMTTPVPVTLPDGTVTYTTMALT